MSHLSLSMMRRFPAALSFLSALLLCSGCGSTAHARKLATAGAAYGHATDVLLRVTQETAADADSARLLSEAQGLTRDDRRALIEKHGLVSETVADLERLRRHARLLARYFEALGRLAAEGADAEAGDAIGAVATALNRLGQELTGSKLLTTAERDLISQTARLSVETVRRSAVDRELSARASAIDQELRVQQTLLDAVRRKLRADLESVTVLGRERDVSKPFLENTISDPRAWIALRRGYLIAPPATEGLKEASDAASKLRAAWTAFTSRRSDETAQAALLADLETILAYAEAVRALQR
jgi:hypothetical protein